VTLIRVVQTTSSKHNTNSYNEKGKHRNWIKNSQLKSTTNEEFIQPSP
jgi:hypothetical protein